jgi:MFS family permease
VQISGPYFTPFMLKQLHFSYATYVMLIACSYLAKSLAVPLWGRVAARYGTYRLLWIGGAGIVPVSALWLVSTSLPWLVFVQLTGGALWAAYELAMFLLFFEAIVDEERTSVLTTYNLAQAIATVGGSLLGGMILLTWGREPNTYLTIFGLSTVARACTLVFLFRASDVPVRSFQMATRTLAIRPEGSVDRPIVASLPVKRSERRGLAALAVAAARRLKRYRIDSDESKRPAGSRGKRQRKRSTNQTS